MAECFLVIIPKNPEAKIPADTDVLRQTLANMAGTTEARVKDYGKLQFIDAGQNATDIRCRDCNARIDADEWHIWMQSDWRGAEGFHLHLHSMPCCGTELTLNDLTYDGPQGFASWFVSARRKGRGPLTDAEIQTLEAQAALPLKAIDQRY
ncbi:MAG: hypothetical protein AAF222_10145 [Pseudomonadota bacterium]